MKSAGLRWQYVAGFAMIALLLILPVFYPFYYLPLYYGLLILMTPLTVARIVYQRKLEERFYRYWREKRRKGFWPNMMRESLFSLVFMTVIICLGQLFGNGLTPVDIVTQLSGVALAVVFSSLVVFAALLGTIKWHENEKRYNRLCYHNKYSAGA